MDKYNADADKFNFDPDMARALLSEAGAEGAKLELMAGSINFLADTLTLI